MWVLASKGIYNKKEFFKHKFIRYYLCIIFHKIHGWKVEVLEDDV